MGEVVAHLRVRLCIGDGAATEPDVGLAGELALEVLRDVLQPLVRERLEVGENVGLPAVVRNHCRAWGREDADDLGHGGLGLELAADLPDARSRGAARDGAGPGGDERDDAGVELATRGGLEAVLRLNGLGRRVAGAVRAEVLGDACTEYATDRGPDHGDDQDAASVRVKKVSESGQHWGLRGPGRRRAGALPARTSR